MLNKLLKKNRGSNFFFEKIFKRIYYQLKFLFREILNKFRLILLFFLNFHNNYRIRKKNSVTFVWDARRNAITFDFISCLYEVHRECLKLGFKTFDLIIYLPDEFTLKPFIFKNYNRYVSSSDLYKRINNLIIPLADSCKCVDSIKKIKSKNELFKNTESSQKIIIPFNFNVYFSCGFKNSAKHHQNTKNELKPIKFPGLTINNKELKFHKEIQIDFDLIQNKFERYITLTLRDYGFSPLRNTNNNDIKIALEFANKKNAKLIIVPDSLKNLKNYNIPTQARICTKARYSIKERIGLYKNSIVNLFSNSGPVGVSIFTNGAKAIIFNHGNGDPNDPSCDSSPLLLKKTGFNFGEQPFLAFDTYYLWYRSEEPYTANHLERAFNIIDNN